MDTFFLLVHIAFGSVALLAAALAFLTEKGPKFHAKVGRIYALAMIGVGLTAGALWSIASYYWVQNLYWAGAVLFSSFGFSFGLAARTIPDDLYVGWVRVLHGDRVGHRIPIDAKDRPGHRKR